MTKNCFFYVLMFVMLLCFRSVFANEFECLWLKGGGSNVDDGVIYNGDSPQDLAVDNYGNVYMIGTFNNTATFGNNSIVSLGGSEIGGQGDIFLAKYTSSGNLQWITSAGGEGIDEGRGISIDISGNIYITGYFSDTAYFQSKTVVSSGQQDIFIAKYDSLGNCQWVKTAGSSYIDQGTGIYSDDNGNIYLTGYFSYNLTFDSNTVTSNGGSDIFVAKFNSAGNNLWLKSAGSNTNNYSEEGFEIVSDSSGNVYVAGNYRCEKGEAIFDSIAIEGENGLYSDLFIAKYNSSGLIQWVNTATGYTWDQAAGLDIDSMDNIYVTGNVGQNASFYSTNGTISYSNPRDCFFIAKYDSDGAMEWINIDENGSEYGQGTGHELRVDKSDNIYVTGEFSGTELFGSIYLTSNGRRDLFVVKFNSNGDLIWGENFGGSGTEYGLGVTFRDTNDLYISGFYNENLTIGSQAITSYGENDNFITRIKIYEETCSQAELDAKFEDGKQYCIDNPEACGIEIGGACRPSFTGVLPDTVQSYLVLTDESAPFYLSPGNYVQTFGSETNNTVNIEKYARVQFQNFIGANVINIEEAASEFTCSHSGATVYLNSTSGTLIEIAATMTPQTLRFADGSAELVISSGNVMLGNQTVSVAESMIETPLDSSDNSLTLF